MGTGNIANGFLHLFLKNQFKIDCIFGNSSKNIEKSVLKNTFFTNNISNIPSTSDLYIFALSDDAYQEVLEKISKNFDLSPRGIREMLGLNKPIYEKTAAYGHFGREPQVDGSFSWEKTDKKSVFFK